MRFASMCDFNRESAIRTLEHRTSLVDKIKTFAAVYNDTCDRGDTRDRGDTCDRNEEVSEQRQHFISKLHDIKRTLCSNHDRMIEVYWNYTEQYRSINTEFFDYMIKRNVATLTPIVCVNTLFHIVNYSPSVALAHLYNYVFRSEFTFDEICEFVWQTTCVITTSTIMCFTSAHCTLCTDTNILETT